MARPRAARASAPTSRTPRCIAWASPQLRERPARALSGGQQQRLALARAWALQPQLLFLDEPTASLDPSAKREVEALIEEFAAEGMTVVMSTHNLGQAKRLASRVIYLEGGRLIVDLPTARFFNDELPRGGSAVPQRRVALDLNISHIRRRALRCRRRSARSLRLAPRSRKTSSS